MEQPWLDIAVASLGGAIAGTIAWRLSCFLLGAWGVPDAWAAARSAAKGEPAARLELSEAGQGARPSIRFGWRPIHVPVRSPTVVFTHHVLVLVLLLTIAGGVTRILGIGAPSGIHDALAFIIALPAMILMDRVCRGVIATTAKHYEASFTRGFERRFPLREFRTALVVDALEDLLQAMPGAPGGARHLEANFLKFVIEEAGDAYLLGVDVSRLSRGLARIARQAEHDLQTIIFLNQCLSEMCGFLAEEGYSPMQLGDDTFGPYGAALATRDEMRCVSILFIEPGAKYIEKARIRIEQISRRAQEIIPSLSERDSREGFPDAGGI